MLVYILLSSILYVGYAGICRLFWHLYLLSVDYPPAFYAPRYAGALYVWVACMWAGSVYRWQAGSVYGWQHVWLACILSACTPPPACDGSCTPQRARLHAPAPMPHPPTLSPHTLACLMHLGEGLTL